MQNKFYILIFALALSSLLNVGCEESADNKLASAQACLNGLSDSSPTLVAQAQACEAKVNGLTSTQSYVIRCTARFIAGGITTTAMVNAINAIENQPANNQPAILMAALVQGSPANPTLAQSTYDACKLAGASSLEYFAAMSLTGTLMVDASSSADPATFLANCSAAPGNCPDAAIGTAVTSMYDTYCIGSNADSQVCQDVGSAISAGGGDSATIAQYLYNYLK